MKLQGTSATVVGDAPADNQLVVGQNTMFTRQFRGYSSYKSGGGFNSILGRADTFHAIQSRTRVMGWHFSRYRVGTVHIVISQSKHQRTTASVLHHVTTLTHPGVNNPCSQNIFR